VHGVLSASPVVQVRSGATLGGTGQVQSVSVFFNGAISPGASPGNLNASTVLLSTGMLDVELSEQADGAGVYQFIDEDAPLYPMRFYRILSP